MKKIWLIVLIVVLLFSLAACRRTPDPDPIVDTTAPLLFGITDVVVNIGESFNPMQGISAIDDVDGNITSSIVITGEYDIETAGVYVITYTVSDEAGNVATQDRTIVVREAPASELFITNGDFSEPLDGTWTHWAGEGGASTATIVDGELVYEITAAGAQWWSSQLSQPGLRLPQGTFYKLQFEARSDVPREMVVKLENPQYFGYIDTVVELTTTMQVFEIEVFFPDPTIDTGKLIFGAGNIAMHPEGTEAGALTKIYIDNVQFIELELQEDTEAPVITGAIDRTIQVGETFDPLQGITVSDNKDTTLTPQDIVITGVVDNTTAGTYTLTYTLTDESGNVGTVTRTITVTEDIPPSTWVVINGDFSEDQSIPVPQPADTGWGWHGGGQFTVDISEGVAKIDVTQLGTVPFGVQFYQQNRIIEQGRIYRITFDAKADISRPIQVVLEEGINRRFDHVVDLSTEWQTYTIEFQHVLPGYTNGKFGFFMGLVGANSVPTTIYLDNVNIETIGTLEDTTAPVIHGVDDYIFMQNQTFNPLSGVSVYDLIDKSLTVEDIVVTGTVNTEVPGDYTLTYTITNASDNVATYTRVVTVASAIDMLDSTFFLVNGDFTVDQNTPFAQPADTGWGWHGNGTFNILIENGIATIDVINVGTVPHGVQFYQQNRVIEAGATYLVTFDARADVERALRLSLEMGTSVQWFEIVDISTDWVTYQAEIRVPAQGFSTGKFAFFMGLVESDSPATKFYLDNVSIELIGYVNDETPPIIIGADDRSIDRGLSFDPLAGISVFDIYDKSLTPEDIVITGNVDTEIPGVYTLTYTLTDRYGNETSLTREITIVDDGTITSSFKIVNGDFTEEQLESAPSVSAGAEITGWRWHNHGTGGVVTGVITGGVAVMDVTEIGHHPYGVQFYQQNRIFEQDRVYRFTFDARADVARPIQVILEQGWTRRFTFTVDITTEWQTYVIEIDHDIAGYENGKFGFFLGNAGAGSVPTTFYFDNVRVEGLLEMPADEAAPVLKGAEDTIVKQHETFDPMAGLTVFDQYTLQEDLSYVAVSGTVDTSIVGAYTLTYTVTDTALNESIYTRVIHVVAEIDMLDSTWIIRNGDFTTDQSVSDSVDGWDWRTSGTGAGSTIIENGIATVDVTSIGTVPHGYQLNQFHGITETGGIYKVTFDAKADIARSIKVVLENAAIFTREFDLDIAITTDWDTYTIIFTHKGTGLTNGKIGFFLGNVDEESVATTFYFDNINIELIGYHVDNSAPIIIAEDIEIIEGEVFDPLAGVKVFDLYDRTLTPEALVVTGTVDTNIVASYQVEYQIADRQGNTTTITRSITVVQAPIE